MRKSSLRQKLMTMFLIASTVPILLFSLYMAFDTSSILQENTQTLTENSLKQIDDNIEILLSSYEDVLYQIYTDDDVVNWVTDLDEDQTAPVATSQLRRFLRAVLNTKDYIRAITIITDSGKIITYDQITPTSNSSMWLQEFSLSAEELYNEVSSDNKTHILPTEYATKFANSEFYLFHMAHRIIDYTKLDSKIGIAILSLDEELLNDVLQSNIETNSENVLVDQDGIVISCMDKSKIGTCWDEEEWVEDQSSIDVYSYDDEELHWEIFNLTDNGIYRTKLLQNMISIGIACIVLCIVSLIIIWRLSEGLVGSVQEVVSYMRKAGQGDLSVRIPKTQKMTKEIDAIADQFNETVEELDDAIKKERETSEKQKEAEVKALEAQINPHFLYNTLDTINWMAIEKNDYDISNAINSLAIILRYAISDSNAIVTVRDEVDWLKRYVFLQQFRLKNKFIRNINVASEVMDFKIHKLILQPFVENAIIHGFREDQEEYILDVTIQENGDFLEIIIADNGTGIDQSVLDNIRRGEPVIDDNKSHIGMANAINRLHSYYGERAIINIDSTLEHGTIVTIQIPAEDCR